MRPLILKRKSMGARRFIDAMPPAMAEQLRQLQHHPQHQTNPEAPADLPESAPPVLPQEPSAPPDTPPPPERSAAVPSKGARNELQSRFLTANLNRVVTIYLVNGIRLTGRLQGYDPFIVILAGPDGKETLTYKHAISTIVPGLSNSSPPHGE